MKPPLKVAELDHLVLRCRDQPRMLEFYTGVLGLVEERRIDALGLVQLRAGQSLLDLVPAAAPRLESALNLDHFCFGVEIADFDATIACLRSHQVELIGAPTTRYGARGFGTSIYLRDPEGNVVELKQMPPAASH